MKVHIKLHATLRKYVPAGAQGDTVIVEVPDGATVSDVLAQLRIPPEHARMIVSRNAQLEPGATLEDGQEVNLFPPLAGGVGLLGGTPHRDSPCVPVPAPSPHIGVLSTGVGISLSPHECGERENAARVEGGDVWGRLGCPCAERGCRRATRAAE